MKRFTITITDDNGVVLDQIKACYRVDKLDATTVWYTADPNQLCNETDEKEDLEGSFWTSLNAAWARINIMGLDQ